MLKRFQPQKYHGVNDQEGLLANEMQMRSMQMHAADTAVDVQKPVGPDSDDAVFMFASPFFKNHEDNKDMINVDELRERCFVNQKECEKHFQRVCKLPSTVTKEQFRLAMYMDFCGCLDSLGLHVKPFRSIDGDQIFLRVSIKDAKVCFFVC